MCDDLRKIRGVQQIKLVTTTALLPPLHSHGALERRATRALTGRAMSVSSTADPNGARAHARAMAGTRVEAMPTVPASAAADLPAGVPREAMLWDETIAAGGYASRRSWRRGARLRLIDLAGRRLRLHADVQRRTTRSNA